MRQATKLSLGNADASDDLMQMIMQSLHGMDPDAVESHYAAQQSKEEKVDAKELASIKGACFCRFLLCFKPALSAASIKTLRKALDRKDTTYVHMHSRPLCDLCLAGGADPNRLVPTSSCWLRIAPLR